MCDSRTCVSSLLQDTLLPSLLHLSCLTGRRLSLMYTLMMMAVPTGTATAAWQAHADCFLPLNTLHTPETTVPYGI